MIQIVKGKAPAILTTAKAKGPQATAGMNAAYEAGQRSFEFDKAIYGHESVKTALIAMQHGKCCYCESKLLHITAGDIEHFRPKAGFQQSDKQKLQKPGYYWLAYDWSNLFLSCEECNRRCKRNLFPLLNPDQRVRSHRDDIADELPLFVDPGNGDPEALIGFRDEYPFGRDADGRGDRTFREIGLDREPLNERRRDLLANARTAARTLRRCRRILEASPNAPPEVHEILRDAEAQLARY